MSAIDTLERAALLELYDLTDACDSPYSCLLASTCPRAARVKRVQMRKVDIDLYDKLENVGVAVSTPAGQILYINPCLERILGLTMDNITRHRAAFFYVNPEKREGMIRHLQEGPVLGQRLEIATLGGPVLIHADTYLSRWRGRDVLITLIREIVAMVLEGHSERLSAVA